MIAIVVAIVAFVPMIGEAIVSARHEATLRRRGAIEPEDDVYRVMLVAYPMAFACLAIEAWLRPPHSISISVWGLWLFALAKALKYWAIATLGERWTFRVLVPPTSSRIVAGPYRFIRHPNYVAVAGELVAATLMTQAWLTGPIVTIGFALLMLARIRVEERALGMGQPPRPH